MPFRDLRRQVTANKRGLQIQTARDLTQQIARRAGRPVQVDDFEEIGIQLSRPHADSRRFSGADFAGQQAGAAMIDQELQPGLRLLPAGIFEQLFGIRFVTEGDFLEAEEGFKHRCPPLWLEATRHS